MFLREENQFAESGGVVDGEFRENFAIHLDAGFFESGDESAVFHTLISDGCVYAGDPQSAEIPFLIAAVSVRVSESLHYRFVFILKVTASSASVTLGKLMYLVNFLVGGDSSFRAWHFFYPPDRELR